MKFGDVIIEKTDYLALKKILNFHKYYHDDLQKDALDILKVSLDHAKICDTSEVPEGIVRLYSNVTVTISGKKQTFQLVLEDDHTNNDRKVSVRSILGAALIGLSVGDQVKVPDCMAPIVIEHVEWLPKDTMRYSLKNE
ncbi:GreA/GreB family elongation factor [Muricauda sp. CAU 1633]|uniref:GreA/GreB family elongation factor n=1 Tax=Allomuricauda sp. CAU 1633 TaxID=2816036 RepID=UPI001A8DEB38|nr:GreA/GreB family elongation factor [Muricauda sp. CAU 1633]MBO0323544.1 GreA/GreB family elongation factor [Muricauda sp. CAU 1633]